MFEMKPYRRNQVSTWNPFNEMDEFEKHFFDDNFFGSRALAEFKTDITDEGNAYQLKADLPGFRKEDIHLDVEEDTLIISAERHSENEEKDKKGKFVRCERSYGSYARSFDVSGIKVDGITAKYDDGVLTLTMPKRDVEVKSSKHLEIE